MSDLGSRYNDYAFKLGTFNELDTVCIVGERQVKLIFDLSASGEQYVLEDVRFFFPAGFNTADSPFKTIVTGKRAAVVTFKGSSATLAQRFGYDLILRNTHRGECLVLDPTIKNVPN